MTSDRRTKGIHFAVLLSVWMVLVSHTAAFAGHGVEDSIDTIPADRVKRLLDSGTKLVLIDLRPTKEFQENRSARGAFHPNNRVAETVRRNPQNRAGGSLLCLHNK